MNIIRIGAIALTFLVLIGCEKEEAVRVFDAPKDAPPATAPAMLAMADAADPHAGHGHGGGPLTWTAPESWKPQPAGEMRFAVLQLSDNPPVQLTVIPLGAASGDLAANVNRWEQQIGLPPTPADKLDTVTKKITPNGLDVTTVDLQGKEQRMLAAIVPHGGRVWYFKAVGPNDVLAKEKANFDTFMASLKPGEAAPAEHAAAGVDAGAAGAGAAGAAGAGAVPVPTMKLAKFAAPADWKEIPGSTGPRMIAFNIGPAEQKAEMIVTRFAANNAGNFLDNINRWRNQIGLPPVSDTRDVPMSDASAGKEPAVMIEINNPGGGDKPARKLRVAMASVGPDLWFFKMTGPPDVVDKQREAFDAFLKSVEYVAEGGAK